MSLEFYRKACNIALWSCGASNHPTICPLQELQSESPLFEGVDETVLINCNLRRIAKSPESGAHRPLVLVHEFISSPLRDLGQREAHARGLSFQTNLNTKNCGELESEEVKSFGSRRIYGVAVRFQMRERENVSRRTGGW